MFQSQLLHNQPYVAWLFRVQENWLALADSAEAAPASADISQDQEGGGVVAPALTNIRAARLLTDSVKVMPPQNPLEAEVVGISWGFDFDPIRMSSWHSSLNSV